MTTPSRVLLASSISLWIAAPACSEPIADDTDTGSGSSETSLGEESTSTTTGTTTGDDSTTGPTSTDGASSSSSGSSTSGEVAPEPSPWDGEPFPWDGWGSWSWYEFPDAFCRDGSNTGVYVRFGKGPGLVVFFDGGGACFNALTCANNPDSLDPWKFHSYDGVLSDDPAVNPVADWNFVYVPYCTGDVHAGARTDVTVPGVEQVQQFVGYRNVEAFLERIVPTFAAAPNVLVTGSSAGGFGAGVNYDRIARAFPDARVTLLDDSGPPMVDEVLAPCLQQQWSDLWGFDDTLPQDCEDCFPSEGGGLANLARYLAKAHPDQQLGLVTSTADLTIRFFFGYGADDCMPQTINIPAAEFEAGLVDLRENYIDEPEGVWSTYYVGDSDHHVWLLGTQFSGVSVDGVRFVDWFEQLLAGEAGHVGP